MSPFAATSMEQLDDWIAPSVIEAGGDGDMSDSAAGGHAGSCPCAAIAHATDSSRKFRRKR
ncbi:MAG: hypothetical protein ACRES2_03760 [Steroidobacteraceae bacterium]